MREYFEEWTKKAERPAFTISELKKAVRSENVPHNKLEWKGNARDAALISAEDVYLGLNLLSRLHPEKAVDSMVLSALFPLRKAIAEKVKETEPALRSAGDGDPAYNKACQLEEAFTSAIDRALDRLMSKSRSR